MHLTDYFAPLNIFNLSIFLFFFLAMDIVGNNLASLLKFPNFLRYVNWIFGLGLFIFIWFLLHLFIPFRTDYILVSIFLFVLPSLPFYIKKKGLISLIKEILSFPYPLIFLLPIAEKLFFLLSLPPYVTDEIAYHFYSPAEMVIRKSWNFNDNISLYYMLPQTLETGFRLMFSLTNTYTTARLLHFMIFFSSVSAISIFLKERINIFVALFYSLFALLLFAIPLVDSTRGYIDVAPAILSNLLLITILSWLTTKNRGALYASFALVGLIIGIKYTVLGFTTAVAIFVIAYMLINKEQYLYFNLKAMSGKIRNNLVIILIPPVLVIVMGGYWYIKNFIITANPIYPFVFQCKDNIICGNKNEFFGNFGTEFRIDNLPKFIQVAKETLK